MELEGTSTVTGAVGGTIAVTSPSQLVLESGATFNDESGNSGNGLTIGGTGTVLNDGTWEKTVGTNTSTISAAFSSTGTSSLNLANVEVATGTLDLTGGGADTFTSYSGAGTIEFGGGTRTLDVNSSITTANAEFSGGTTTINGTFSDPGTITLNGGTLSVAGAVTAGSLVQTSTSSDVLTGAGTLTVTGTASFAAAVSTESGGGTTLLESGASFATGGNNFGLTLSSRTLELEGTSTVTGAVGGTIAVTSPSQLVLESGATFNDESGTSGNGLTIGGTGTVTNDGTWEKTVGTNTSTISAAFNNTGIVNVEAGTLTLSGGLTNSGELEISGGKLDVSTTISGSGTVLFSGAGTFELANPTGFGEIISGFGTTNTLDLGGFSSTAGNTFTTSTSYNGTNTTLTINDTTKSTSESVVLAGNYTPAPKYPLVSHERRQRRRHRDRGCADGR